MISLKNNSIFERDYGLEMPHAQYGLDVNDQSSANLIFYALDRGGGRILDLEAAPDRLGMPVPATIRRTGLFADPGHDWVQVDRVKVQLSGQACQVKLGDQVALDAAVTWRNNFAVDPSTDYRTDARANGNLIAYEVNLQTITDWQMSNLMLLVQKSGARG